MSNNDSSMENDPRGKLTRSSDQATEIQAINKILNEEYAKKRRRWWFSFGYKQPFDAKRRIIQYSILLTLFLLYAVFNFSREVYLDNHVRASDTRDQEVLLENFEGPPVYKERLASTLDFIKEHSPKYYLYIIRNVGKIEVSHKRYEEVCVPSGAIYGACTVTGRKGLVIYDEFTMDSSGIDVNQFGGVLTHEAGHSAFEKRNILTKYTIYATYLNPLFHFRHELNQNAYRFVAGGSSFASKYSLPSFMNLEENAAGLWASRYFGGLKTPEIIEYEKQFEEIPANIQSETSILFSKFTRSFSGCSNYFACIIHADYGYFINLVLVIFWTIIYQFWIVILVLRTIVSDIIVDIRVLFWNIKSFFSEDYDLCIKCFDGALFYSAFWSLVVLFWGRICDVLLSFYQANLQSVFNHIKERIIQISRRTKI